ncbi:ThiF family adenylyltransferase [Bacillus aquiflavi]|uniref:ThiF family adenylyltransferase n=1 Tax=Bacillus aquiflavi TaxID=2672567 RepID=A0A6B3W0Z5_9BACI|nr:MoeB/ThiF family adenylyltransferase [Bacillus aquiflavi]MBA4537269.1 ThiF family adenylyltransferase [Bacillus aquiflavi]NEY81526.1 thiamine biosynthesis protein MoeB [Bacillus aquiflavi]UAC49468.1 ThiF family adenylyltransferase [Bacillus aquiflavi]
MDDRYSRQILFSPIGKEGQIKLKHKHVLIIGAGALGTSIAEILTRSGVENITIVDRDYVEWSNLQRQQLYTEADAKKRIPKVIAAKERLEAINSKAKIKAKIVDVTPIEMIQLVKGIDLIMDATDNFDIRMMINDASQKYNIPWIYGAVVGSYGISYTIIPNKSPCLHCLMKQLPISGLTCDTGGIISPIVQLITAHQTVEALKILTDNWEALRNKLISFNIWTNQQSSIDVKTLKDRNCLSCGQTPTFPFLNYENQTKTAVLCGRNTVQIRPASTEKRDLQKIASQLENMGKVEQNRFLLSFTIKPYRFVMFQDGRVLVHGTNDVIRAKSLYYRYFG